MRGSWGHPLDNDAAVHFSQAANVKCFWLWLKLGEVRMHKLSNSSAVSTFTLGSSSAEFHRINSESRYTATGVTPCKPMIHP